MACSARYDLDDDICDTEPAPIVPRAAHAAARQIGRQHGHFFFL
jgi:hypothetical protein